MLARIVVRENAIAAYGLRGANYRPPNAWNR